MRYSSGPHRPFSGAGGADPIPSGGLASEVGSGQPVCTANSPRVAPSRVFTVPNILSVIRLVGIPIFLGLLLIEHDYLWSFIVLFLSGFTDWLDGKLARLLDQSSRLGELLDPAADRLYMVIVPVALALEHIIPWWTVLVLFGRDCILATTLFILRPRGITALPVIYLGKAATFALMLALPLVLGGAVNGWFGEVAHPCGWALLWWGLGLYWWTMLLYWRQTLEIRSLLPPMKR